MRVSQALAWLCAEPRRSFTFNLVLRRGWPGLASFFLLPKPFILGRAARALERCLFLGGLAAVVVVAGWPALSVWRVVLLKVIAVVAGWVIQFTLKAAGYLIGGFERIALTDRQVHSAPKREGVPALPDISPRQGKRIDYGRYGKKKSG